MKKKKVVVTGGSGFVGANLVRALVNKNFEVHLLLRESSNTWRIKDILTKTHIHKTLLSDTQKLKILFKRIDPNYIFHLSAFGNYSWHSGVGTMIQTNVVELENLLEATKDINYESFVNTGSSTEYGFINRPIKEVDKLNPVSFYGATKSAGTLLCQVYAKRYDKPISTVRLFSVYGPYEEKARFIPTIIRAALSGQEVFVTKENIKRDFIYVEDVVSAYLKLARKPFTGEIFNIGTGLQFSNKKVVQIIGSMHGELKISETNFPARHWDSGNCVANTDKSREMINFSATYDIKRGLEKTYQWFKKNNYLYKE